jgi:hypothetical protein
MIRKLKVVSLTVVAVFALTAVAASAASAATEFHATSAPSISTGVNEGNHVFKTGETSVVCKTAKFSGTQTALAEPTATVHPEYSSCEFLGSSASVETTGCNYVLSANGPVGIACSGASKINFTLPGICTLSFGSQSTVGGATYTNVGSGTTEQSKIALSTEETFTKTGSLCFLIPGGVATVTGTVLTSGFKDEAGLEGARVGISVS